MIFRPTILPGAVVVEPERNVDDRGYFTRTFCRNEFLAHGLPGEFVNGNVSYNARKGTLRGMHFQRDPHAEGKLVRCVRGRALDVIVDLRPNSPAYCSWTGVELSLENGHALFVPPGFAHGFITLEDQTELFYLMTEFYYADLAAGVRWNDPAFGIVWPDIPPILNARDANLPDFKR